MNTMKEEKIFFEDSEGNKLCGILALPETGNTDSIAIICHGFTTHKNRPKYTELAKRLYAAGIASLRFDLFGHGESNGDFADISVTKGIDCILSAIKFVKGRGYSKIGLVGNSFGGICSFVAATRTNDLVILALISPVSDYPEVERLRRSEKEIDDWKDRGWTIHKSSKGVEYKLNYSFWEDIQHYLVYDIAKRITVPTLIVHGDRDDLVPIGQSRRTSKLIPNCRLIEIKGADHRYQDPDHFDQLINAVLDFVAPVLH